MDVITTARSLGRAIQSDERYLNLLDAQTRNDRNRELQDMIRQFSEKRNALNVLLQAEDKDREEIARLDSEVKSIYADIFASEDMANFTRARNEFQDMLTFVNQIITGSAQGQNPDAIEYQESCGGDCGGCAGCS